MSYKEMLVYTPTKAVAVLVLDILEKLDYTPATKSNDIPIDFAEFVERGTTVWLRTNPDGHVYCCNSREPSENELKHRVTLDELVSKSVRPTINVCGQTAKLVSGRLIIGCQRFSAARVAEFIHYYNSVINAPSPPEGEDGKYIVAMKDGSVMYNGTGISKETILALLKMVDRENEVKQ